MKQRRAAWLLHLRLLPGGDADLMTGLVVSGTLAIFFALFGLIGGLALRDATAELGFVTVLGSATGVPAALLVTWTGVRIARSKPLGVDEAGVDLGRKRVFFPEDAVRVPQAAVLIALRPRQVQVPLADGRGLRLFFRANADPDDLLRLARNLRSAAPAPGEEPGLEDWVESRAREEVEGVLPDPGAIAETLGEELLEEGVVVVRHEVV